MKARTLAEVVEHIYANTRPDGGCLVTTKSRDGGGYARQGFQGKNLPAHQLVARYYMGPRPDGQQVRHLCGRGADGCVTASHLRYGSPEENAQDSVRHGTYERRGAGRDAHNRSLTDADADGIREAFDHGHSRKSIAASLGIPYHVVKDLLGGKTYRISPLPPFNGRLV